MNNYEDWSHLLAKRLKGEADVISAIEKDELDDAAATEAFVRTVLQPFLPENYGIGNGQIIDAYGNRSNHFDVVVYNRNFPRIRFSGTQSDYLYESVLASFSIRAKYLRKTFFESMDACASLAQLQTKADYNVLVQLAKRNGLKSGPNKTFIHEDPLSTTRFELIGRPPAFMFGFNGIKGSLRQLQENLELWIQQRQEHHLDTPMRAFPAVIATQGCFAWRNAAPLALSNREMLGLGIDVAPIRLIILQMLHLLNRRLNVTSDGFGLKPNLGSYLSQFTPPEFELGVGDVDQLVALRPKAEEGASAPRSQSAKDYTADKSAAATVRQAPVAAKKATSESVEIKPAKTESAAPVTSKGVFDTPSPFASAPAPGANATKAAEPKARPNAPVAPLGSAPIPSKDSRGTGNTSTKPPAAPLGSAPIPSMDSRDTGNPPAKPPAAPLGSAPIPSMDSRGTGNAPAKPPTAPLGSAPIPSMDSRDTGNATAKPPVAPLGSAPIPAAAPTDAVVPRKQTVDLDLTGETLPPRETQAGEPLDFESTIIIAPDASLSSKKSATSTNAFIDRVKQQLSNGETPAQTKEESFSSTVPH